MKSHHYNPQVYLRQFTNPACKSQLWEYDLTKGTAKKSTPKRSGCEDHYHSFTRKDGQRDDHSLEKSFGFVENHLPKLFTAVRNQLPLTDDLWTVLFWFAAIQRARCPKARTAVQATLGNVYRQFWEIVKQRPDFEQAMTKRGLDPMKIRDAEFDIQAEQGTTLLMLLRASKNLARCFARMEWRLLYAPRERYFITSDDPVCCWALPARGRPFQAVGPADADVEITFPLTRRVCAHGSWNYQVAEGCSHISAEKVDVINWRTVVNGWRFLYGPIQDAQIQSFVRQVAANHLASGPA